MPLTASEIAYYAHQAGFRGADLNRAVAIALAESSGNPAAYNPESAAGTSAGRGSFGLWQIYSTAHPQYDRTKLNDPLYNARAAFEVFREAGNRFTPWSTWNQGIAQGIGKDLSFTLPRSLNRSGQRAQVTPSNRSRVTTNAVRLATNAAPSGRSDLAYAQFAPGIGGSVGKVKTEAESRNIIVDAARQLFTVDKLTVGMFLAGFVLVLAGFVMLNVAWAKGPGNNIAQEAIPLAIGAANPAAGIVAEGVSIASKGK